MQGHFFQSDQSLLFILQLLFFPQPLTIDNDTEVKISCEDFDQSTKNNVIHTKKKCKSAE